MSDTTVSRYIASTFVAVGTLLSFTAISPQCIAAAPDAHTSWTADNGNGTYSNPLFYEEFEDPDVIRVGDDYYLAGTTMHMSPAVQLMHSKDLVNWELTGYCMDRLDLGPAFRLEGGNVYGRGIWAPCIRYHQGMFYVFSNVNGVGLQVFRSKSIRGPWERNQFPGRHDLSVLFDDDGKVYIISGNRSPYPIEELAPDLRSFVPGVRYELDAPMGEGHHLYKINGKYVDVSAIPGGPVDQMVAVADSIQGPWKVERMVQGESMGVTAAAPDLAEPNDRGLWLHQGGIVDTPYAWIGVVKSAEGATLQTYSSPRRSRRFGRQGPEAAQINEPVVSPTAPPDHLWLRVHCNFDNDQAIFSWSADGQEFTPLGDPFRMVFQLTTFQGVRPSLFHYNTTGQPGGYVDFDNYTVDEPRARGIEREIPMGKTIVLTSSADGSQLAADVDSSTLVSLPAGHDVPTKAKFEVIDLGLGRVALKSRSGKFVSVASPENVILKVLGDAEPGEAETFQWINLMRGDTMLVSLTNHRYLATKPNSPGPVTVTATGPTPARKGGACFKWQEVSASIADSPPGTAQRVGASPVGNSQSAAPLLPRSDDTHAYLFFNSLLPYRLGLLTLDRPDE